MTVHLHVVIDGSADGLPVRQHVVLRRQWLQGRSIQFREKAGTRALTFPERAMIEFL